MASGGSHGIKAGRAPPTSTLKNVTFLIVAFHTLLQEIGPYGVGWKPRKHTWTRAANLLFIDNPVGTGWSYVDKHGSFGAFIYSKLAEDILKICLNATWCAANLLFVDNPGLLYNVDKHGSFGGWQYALPVACGSSLATRPNPPDRTHFTGSHCCDAVPGGFFVWRHCRRGSLIRA